MRSSLLFRTIDGQPWLGWSLFAVSFATLFATPSTWLPRKGGSYLGFGHFRIIQVDHCELLNSQRCAKLDVVRYKCVGELEETHFGLGA